MNIIQTLPPHVADLIAAGEVVERPASVVKELTENSIDAGAKHITVEIQNGGMALIRVTDDGCGMTSDDASTAFLRHATSKIRTAEDLEKIQTLGFRGEALAATAAVARVEVLTKTEDAPLGTRVRLEGGKILEKSEAGCPKGTTMVVRDLFFNTPARMKFMKRDSVESSAVLGVLQHQALCNPSVSFRYVRDGQEELSTPGDGELLSAIHAVYSRAFAKELVLVEGVWDNCRLYGYVTNPMATRGNRNYQQFFVNGRYVKSKLLSAGLEEAYRNQMMVGRFPGCVLFLTLPQEAVDVNVHPAKTEVKFLSEQTVFDCVRYGVQSALNKTPVRAEVHLPKTAPVAEKPAFRTMTAEQFRTLFAPEEKTPVSRPLPLGNLEQNPVQDPVLMEQTFIPLPKETPKIPQKETPPAPVISTPVVDAPAYRIVGEVLNSYLVLEEGQDVVLIDKHAAHERILFEKLLQRPKEVMRQRLIEPIAVALTPEEHAIVLQEQDFFRDCGMEVEDFGDQNILLRELPADLDPHDAKNLITEFASDLLEGRLPQDHRRDHLLHSVACKAAIKAGWHTTAKELEVLAHEVMSREDLKYCPHGRPICVRLTAGELEKFFKRA